MTQKQFLRALSRKLRGLPAAEREEALRYYKKVLQNAEIPRGEDVTDRVGTPEQAARGILADSRIRQEREAAAQSERAGGGSVARGIVTAPVALVLGIIAFAVVLSLFVSGVALAAGGVAMPLLAFGAAGALGQGLVIAGYGLLMLSVGALLVTGAVVLWRLTGRGLRALVRGKGAEDV